MKQMLRQKVVTIRATAQMMKELRANPKPDDEAELAQFFDHSLDFIVFLAGQVLTQLDGDQFLKGK